MDMKSFKNCNVALCFSGQSRTFEYCSESVKNFFKSDRGNKFYYFGHTSNKNNFKGRFELNNEVGMVLNEELDISDLCCRMNNAYNFKRLTVEPEIPHCPAHWMNQSLYSQMYSNYLKQQFELEHNMMFELVIRLRFDLCFPEGKKFEDCVNFALQEKTLYTHFGLMRNEFVLPNPNQIIHFGTSLTMDLVDSFYNSMHNNSFNKLVGHSHDNLCFERVGDGAMLYKWMTIKNILPFNVDIPFIIVRLNNKHLNYKTDWKQMHNLGFNFNE
jgi:hypothetical protein